LPFVKHMPPFACPDSTMANGSVEHLRLAEACISSWTAHLEEATAAWLAAPSLSNDWVSRLSHPLSDVIEEMNRDRSRRGASLAELEACQALTRLRPACSLAAELTTIASALGVKPAAFRTHVVRTRGDNFGNVVTYRPPHCVTAEIEDLGIYLERHVAHAPLLSAIVAYCGVTAIHPFADGNGRTARILFNLMLRRALNPHFFLPVFDIAGLSRGGLIIRQRQAHYHRQWEPVVDYFCDSVAALLAATDPGLKPAIAGTIK